MHFLDYNESSECTSEKPQSLGRCESNSKIEQYEKERNLKKTRQGCSHCRRHSSSTCRDCCEQIRCSYLPTYARVCHVDLLKKNFVYYLSLPLPLLSLSLSLIYKQFMFFHFLSISLYSLTLCLTKWQFNFSFFLSFIPSFSLSLSLSLSHSQFMFFSLSLLFG